MNTSTENTAENEELQANQNADENAAPTAENADNLAKDSEAGENWPAKYAEMNDKYIRLYSEFDNFRRRTAKEKIEMSKSAGEEVFKALLPVVDDLERGIKSMETAESVSAVKEGVSLIFNKFNSVLTQKGLQPMESQGKVFDADLHEAITNIPAPSEDMKGKVVDEVEKGYLLNGKVIRFAKVVVGN